ncbi:Pyridoxamine 5 -phosphate oxidase-related FMN-binding protein [Thermobacillus xylanilyticus]|uniref:Pyridoxamine 5 -phosphate oxidase-related FMN-binding protein n=1 Tax=Thermobacillus xylanilyticus TaxID=76633 RepID=A0ABM8V6K8_THEXY|nr:pyridoxamine 5'-phosphate oxidase family protein [Thermobacillus xylanilyticus]REJ17053.1 MAG: flavin-nucleotide-binding protein [Paenibacillaceae bacterium]CAG5090680.1 Pyridoxamine 5 -phosphate oxidase-related FMN-binding protein [Thermobacillus xylanilyticus]
MRRREFEMTDQREIEQFLEESSFGFLSAVRPDGRPSITPLNFVYADGAVYFHGSRAGDKMDAIRSNPHAAFAVAREYAIIPSYFTDPVMACPASAYFKSVLIAGRIEIVEDIAEKAMALEAMMKKLQPEGGYEPIRPDDPRYAPRLKSVAVLKLVPSSITAKFKFGQNLSDKARSAVTAGLLERGLPLDRETAGLMERYRPGAPQQ